MIVGDQGALDRHLAASGVLNPAPNPLQPLEGVAGLAGVKGDLERAALLLGAAVAARRSAEAPLSPGERVDVNRTAATAREALGKERFAQALARGEALPLREAIALAEQSLAEQP